MADNDSDIGAFLAGFVVGGLVGAAVALILAPQSGEETRAQIRQKGIELRDRAEESVDEARRKADETATEARRRAEELAAAARQRAEALAKEAREKAAGVRLVLEEQRDRLESAIDAGRQAARRKRGEPSGDAASPESGTPPSPPGA
jgi:gas vesicle protein